MLLPEARRQPGPPARNGRCTVRVNVRSGEACSYPVLCNVMCGDSHMATNLSIDPDLIERALEVSGERTKKAAVTKALEEFIARRRQRRLLDLMGKLEWDSSFDYKSERSRD